MKWNTSKCEVLRWSYCNTSQQDVQMGTFGMFTHQKSESKTLKTGDLLPLEKTDAHRIHVWYIYLCLQGVLRMVCESLQAANAANAATAQFIRIHSSHESCESRESCERCESRESCERCESCESCESWERCKRCVNAANVAIELQSFLSFSLNLS